MNVDGSGFRLRRSISRRAKEDPPDDQRYFDSSPTRPTAIPTHCSVSGSLALILRLSRVIGIAPLAFERQATSWEIRNSRTSFIYSVILIGTLNVIAVSALALDVLAGRERAVNMRTPTKSVVFLVDFIVVTLTINVAAFTAPARMDAMIGVLSRIQKINLEVSKNSIPDHVEKKLRLVVAAIISFSLVVIVFSYYMTVAYAFANNRNRTVAFLYLAYSCLYFSLIFINLQFALVVVTMTTALKAINDRLDDMCRIIKNEGLQNMKDNATHEIPFDITVPLKSVNIVIDRITYNTDILLPRKRTIQETVRALAHSYLDVCDLMDEVNRCFGVIALMRLLVTLVHLIITPYYLLTALFMKAELNRAILIQSVSCTKQLLTMLLLVEPCHWTHQEFNRTRHLMVHLTCRTATVIGPFVLELKRFFYCICLINIEYAPMGICTLTRPICVAILGAVTTYLVIVIQFNTKDDAYDR